LAIRSPTQVGVSLRSLLRGRTVWPKSNTSTWPPVRTASWPRTSAGPGPRNRIATKLG